MKTKKPIPITQVGVVQQLYEDETQEPYVDAANREGYLTVGQAATLLGIPRKNLDKYSQKYKRGLKQGRIVVGPTLVYDGSRPLYLREGVEMFFEQFQSMYKADSEEIDTPHIVNPMMDKGGLMYGQQRPKKDKEGKYLEKEWVRGTFINGDYGKFLVNLRLKDMRRLKEGREYLDNPDLTPKQKRTAIRIMKSRSPAFIRMQGKIWYYKPALRALKKLHDTNKIDWN